MTARYQAATIAKLFDPLHPRLRQAVPFFARRYPEQFRPGSGFAFQLHLMPNGRIGFHPPVLAPEAGGDAVISVHVLNCERPDDLPSHEHIKLRYEVALSNLIWRPGNYSLYSLTFDLDEEDTSFRQLKNGYIGITKRSPIVRFREHRNSAATGTGSVVHRAWRGLAESGLRFHPVFRVSDIRPRTLDEAYAAEEHWVALLTLAPKGLNAIPGGMAGVRMMHEMRLLGSVGQVSIEDRDAALEKFVSGQPSGPKTTHFRSGHVRRLAGERTTWVSSCWVNLPGGGTA